MNEISIQQVKELAKLARLGLTDQEEETMSQEMTAILSYAQMLDEVNTEKVQPTSQVTGLDNIFRLDKIKKSEIQIKKKLENTPNKEKNFIKVKKILE